MKHSIDGAIFDLDGTLLDSMSVWATLGSDYLRERGIVPRPDVDLRFRVMCLRQAAEYYRNEYTEIDDSVEFLMDEINKRVEYMYFNTVITKPGVCEFLERLRSRGVKMCVATATDRYLVEAALKRNGIDRFFSRIFTCTESGVGKDVPDIYTEAHRFLGTPGDTTYVFEDAPFAARSAKKGGFPVVGVNDEYFLCENDKLKECSEICIDDYSQLYDFFDI